MSAEDRTAQQRCAKYEKVVVELQSLLKESKERGKRQHKEMSPSSTSTRSGSGARPSRRT